jgi:SAM-dependent methyltransferase
VNDNKVIRENIEKYRFYHVIKLDEGVFTPGCQEYVPLQQNVQKALKSISFQGKRVLDVGCRDGLFCFEAEKMGAREVIGIDNDLSPAATEFLIPYFNSKVKMFELNVYDLTPESFGMFDVVIFAGILYHLRYPFWALERIRDVVTDNGQIIIETGVLDAWNRHALLYCPIGSESPYEPTSVTFFNIKGLSDTLYSLGITVRSVDYLYKRKAPSWQLGRLLLNTLRSSLRRMFRREQSPFEYKSELELGMPINRATLICDVTLDVIDHDCMQYWNQTHSFHTTADPF